MKIKASDITRVLDSRGVLSAVIVAMIVSAVYALKSGAVMRLSGDRGLLFASANEWIASPATSLWSNIALIFAVVVLMIYINKAYTVPRNITLLYAIFFVVLQTATPAVTTQLFTGSMLLALVSVAMTIMFGLFGRTQGQSGVFIVFFLLSAAVATQYAYALYIPVFFVGCAQMRILNLRTVLAAIIGLVTPWWLMWGMGIAVFDNLRLPEFHSIGQFGGKPAVITILCCATTVVLAIASYALSLFKLMSYNARTRACNGVLTLVTLATVIAMVADYNNYPVYLPLLNFCTAFFLSHFFVIRNPVRSWIVIISIIAIYYIYYIWRIIV